MFSCVAQCMGGSDSKAKSMTPAERLAANKANHARKKKDRKSLVSNVLGRETGDIKESYVLGKELKKIPLGAVVYADDKRTGERFACKVIAKRKLLLKEDVEDLRKEVAILYHLAGNPEFVQIKAAYEDSINVYLVLENCDGGELFDRIVGKGKYSERQAAAACRSILKVVDKCHSMGVMHRDLHPENFVYDSNKEDSPPKLTAFDSAVFIRPGETFTDVVGSAYYLAPEVLRRKYSLEADIWSVGVILYILLSGQPPFWANYEKDVYDSILRGNVDLRSSPWPSISEQGKDLVRKLLRQNPAERLTAAEALRHPWVKVGGSAPDKPLDSSVVQRMKSFAAMNKMKKLALRVISTCLSEEEVNGLREMFRTMDVDTNGTVSYTELKAGLAMYGANMPDEQVKVLMEAADVDGSGTINYEEFIAATAYLSKTQKEESLFQAFQHFDSDGSGFVTMDELRIALQEDGDLGAGEIEAIIEEVDSDKDGKINYEEFASMMRKDFVEEEDSGESALVFPLTFK